MLKTREIDLIKHRKRFAKGYQGILKCLRETEETQEKLSKKAPELVKRQQELEEIVDVLCKRHA